MNKISSDERRPGMSVQDELGLEIAEPPELPEPPEPPEAAPKMTERDMLELLHRRYGRASHNGGVYAPRYICAEHVRARAGFDCRTADFIAVDTWESTMRQGWLTIHGVEVKVSRSDWLRELKDPHKAADGMRYASHRWLAIPDASMVRDGELPDGWGLLHYVRNRGLIAKVAARDRGGEPLSPTAIAALLRGAVKTATARSAA